MKSTIALIFPAMALLLGFSSAATLQIDFGTDAGAQSSWETLGGTADVASASGSYSGYTDLAAGNVGVSITGIAFSRRSDNGNTNTDFPGTTLDAMYNDMLFRNNNSSTVNVTITGLKAGTFQVTTHHLINTPSPGTFILAVQDSDSPSFGQSVGTFTQGTGSSSSFDPNVITFNVLSNGTDPVILRMTQGTPTAGGTTGGVVRVQRNGDSCS